MTHEDRFQCWQCREWFPWWEDYCAHHAAKHPEVRFQPDIKLAPSRHIQARWCGPNAPEKP